jgi:hypothetical protein
MFSHASPPELREWPESAYSAADGPDDSQTGLCGDLL